MVSHAAEILLFRVPTATEWLGTLKERQLGRPEQQPSNFGQLGSRNYLRHFWISSGLPPRPLEINCPIISLSSEVSLGHWINRSLCPIQSDPIEVVNVPHQMNSST
jgi:hypothetical protein